MKIPHAVAAKIAEDSELLDVLKAASPDTPVRRSICFMLDIPEIPQRDLPTEEHNALLQQIRLVGERAGQTFSGIKGLTVQNLMSHIGMAAVSGTAEALVKAIESDSVKNAFFGDRPIFRGATRG